MRFVFWKSDHMESVVNKEHDPEERRKMGQFSKFLNLLTAFSLSKVIY